MSAPTRTIDRPFKLVFLGDSCVGKSCLVIRYIHDEFRDTQTPTIGSAFYTHTTTVDDTRIRFDIWDTAGQERYRSLAPMYYRGASAAVVVFDVTNNSTYLNAKRWVENLKEAETVGKVGRDIIIALVGNKVDLVSDSNELLRNVSNEEATDYARENNIIYLETSAKHSTNVKDIFAEIVKRIPVSTQSDSTADTVTLSTGRNKSTTVGFCC
jgi:Ras-related protein Rab-5C